MTFTSLTLGGWKQFARVELRIHPRVTILTGANGAGKTTILALFARHFGWGFDEIATPYKEVKTGGITYRFLHWLGLANEGGRIRIGEMVYSNGFKAKITIPMEGGPTYQPEIHQQLQVEGLSIPSHRAVYRYAQVSHISTVKRTRRNAFDEANSQYIGRYFGSGGQPANYAIKQALVGWAVFGGGNNFIDPDEEQAALFSGFEAVLMKIVPAHIGFQKLVIRGQSDVVLVTRTGEFLLDAVSGGLSAIIDLSWQIYLRAHTNEPVTVVIDEVENHLHADMQRRLLPSFTDAFPNVQFIVSTHSPLIVGSVEESAVYALRYDGEMKVYSDLLDLREKGKAASDILREVLGVPFTMPIWVEKNLENILAKYRGQRFDAATVERYRGDMRESGLEHLTGEGLIRLTEGGR